MLRQKQKKNNELKLELQLSEKQNFEMTEKIDNLKGLY